jgi:hypothetical protein
MTRILYNQCKTLGPELRREVVGMESHLHNGGSDVNIKFYNSTNVCTSRAKYAESAEYVFKTAGQSMPGGEIIAERHISSTSTCYYNDVRVKNITKNQSWTMVGDYDYAKHNGNKDGDGDQAAIMAIAIMFVEIPPEGVPMLKI